MEPAAAAVAEAPSCPLTGRAPLRRVQVFSTRLLVNLWKIASGVDVSTLYRDCDRIELYEFAGRTVLLPSDARRERGLLRSLLPPRRHA